MHRLDLRFVHQWLSNLSAIASRRLIPPTSKLIWCRRIWSSLWKEVGRLWTLQDIVLLQSLVCLKVFTSGHRRWLRMNVKHSSPLARLLRPMKLVLWWCSLAMALRLPLQTSRCLFGLNDVLLGASGKWKSPWHMSMVEQTKLRFSIYGQLPH